MFKPLRTFCVLISAMAAVMSFAQKSQAPPPAPSHGYGIMKLVNRPDVQADLQLNDDQKSQLALIRDAMDQSMGPHPSSATIGAFLRDGQKKVDQILTQEQRHRLVQIQVQLEGTQVIDYPWVQQRLKMTDEQKLQAHNLVANFQVNRQSIYAQVSKHQISRQECHDQIAKADADLLDRLHQVLTADQAAQLTTLGGKPFQNTDPLEGY